jgi:hypothetical protein
MFDNFVVIIILFLACALIVRRVYRAIFKNEPVCGCGCTDNCLKCPADINKDSIAEERHE